MCRARIKNLHRYPPKNRLPLRTTPNTVSTQNCTATSNTVIHTVILNIFNKMYGRFAITSTAQPRAYVQPLWWLRCRSCATEIPHTFSVSDAFIESSLAMFWEHPYIKICIFFNNSTSYIKYLYLRHFFHKQITCLSYFGIYRLYLSICVWGS